MTNRIFGGYMKSRTSNTPRARSEAIVVERVADEVLVYDLRRDRAHCLNESAALVWEKCDGQATVEEIAREVGAGEEVVWMAVEELSRAGLMEGRVKRAGGGGVSRREMMKRVAVAAAIGVPVVTSIVAPTASHAANCRPAGQACTTATQCCSGLCNGTCL
jgi:hypothetical protein